MVPLPVLLSPPPAQDPAPLPRPTPPPTSPAHPATRDAPLIVIIPFTHANNHACFRARTSPPLSSALLCSFASRLSPLPSFPLSSPPSFSLSLLALCFFLSLSLSFFPSSCLSLSLSVPLPLCPSLSLSLSFSLCLSLSLSLSLSISYCFSWILILSSLSFGPLKIYRCTVSNFFYNLQKCWQL